MHVVSIKPKKNNVTVVQMTLPHIGIPVMCKRSVVMVTEEDQMERKMAYVVGSVSL
jgi:hypothetical protein